MVSSGWYQDMRAFLRVFGSSAMKVSRMLAWFAALQVGAFQQQFIILKYDLPVRSFFFLAPRKSILLLCCRPCKEMSGFKFEI